MLSPAEFEAEPQGFKSAERLSGNSDGFPLVTEATEKVPVETFPFALA